MHGDVGKNRRHQNNAPQRHFDGLGQDWFISNALAMKILQPCTKISNSDTKPVIFIQSLSHCKVQSPHFYYYHGDQELLK